jgi:ribonucleotide reductase alpha subunit
MLYSDDSIENIIDRLLNDKELAESGLTRENLAKTVESFKGDEIACSVFLKKYALRDENEKITEFTLEDSKNRWAKELVKVDANFKNSKDEKYFRELYDYLLPAGRQMFALGNTTLSNLTLSNCYVTSIEDDSIEGIFNTAGKIAKTYSYGGGIGFCIGGLRPKKSKVSNSARFSTGAVSFMELYSLTTGLIGQSARRGALMITIPVDHPDIEDFIEIKHNNINKVKHANISIKITDKFMKAVEDDENFILEFKTKHESIKREIKAKDLWDKIVQSARDSAEPGILFWDQATRMSPSDTYDRLKIESTNPCVTGDTLVYVADGRGSVPIKQLANEEKDVPVFCLDNKDKIAVRYMRNPRLTGQKLPVYKIILDDGSEVKATENHELYLSSGDLIKVKDLKYGDSLQSVTFYQSNLEREKKIYGKKTNYCWISNKGKKTSEHRLIASFYNNIDINGNYVVHHMDYNGVNNCPSNLKIMTKKEHDFFHSKDMIGDANPMRRAQKEWSEEKWENYKENMSNAISGEKNGRYSGITNEELKEHSLILTKSLGHRFSHQDWGNYARKNNLIKSFSKYRNDHLGGMLGLAKWAAVKCGIEDFDLHPRTFKHYVSLTEQGYNCVIEDGKIFILKNCEICGKEYKMHHSGRAHGICSQECLKVYLSNRNKNSDLAKRQREESNKTWKRIKKENAIKMVETYLDIRQDNKRDPEFKELKKLCKEKGLCHRVGKNSYFKTYSELKEFAKNYNHRVERVEFFGYEDVYNGTVDEFHNFLIGGFECGKSKSYECARSFIKTKNCGEILLEKGGACVLSSLILHNFVKNPYEENAYFDFDLFREMIKRGVRHLDNVVELNIGRHALQEQNESAKLGRRIGLGITGLADMLYSMNIPYDSQESLEFIEKIMKEKTNTEYLESITLAQERGVFDLCESEKHFEKGFCETLPENIKDLGRKHGIRNVTISTIAPNGSLSIMAQCSSGIEPIFAFSYKRYVELGDKRKEFNIYHQGLKRYFEITGNQEIPKFWKESHTIDYNFRIKLQGVLQKYIDSSISSTINLPENVTTDTVSKIYFDAWREGLKGITVYREGSREGILVTDSFAKKAGKPNMDTITYCVKVDGSKFYIMVSYKDANIKQPYQVFVLNYKKMDNDSFIKISNSLIKMLKTQGVSEKRIQKYLDRSGDSLSRMTRFLSLSLKTNNLKNALEILDEHSYSGTLADRIKTILNKSVDVKKMCKNCQSQNIRMEEGCIKCLDCGWSKC